MRLLWLPKVGANGEGLETTKARLEALLAHADRHFIWLPVWEATKELVELAPDRIEAFEVPARFDRSEIMGALLAGEMFMEMYPNRRDPYMFLDAVVAEEPFGAPLAQCGSGWGYNKGTATDVWSVCWMPPEASWPDLWTGRGKFAFVCQLGQCDRIFVDSRDERRALQRIAAKVLQFRGIDRLLQKVQVADDFCNQLQSDIDTFVHDQNLGMWEDTIEGVCRQSRLIPHGELADHLNRFVKSDKMDLHNNALFQPPTIRWAVLRLGYEDTGGLDPLYRPTEDWHA